MHLLRKIPSYHGHSNSNACESWPHPTAVATPNCRGHTQLPRPHPTVMATSNCHGHTQLPWPHPTAVATPNCQGHTQLPTHLLAVPITRLLPPQTGCPGNQLTSGTELKTVSQQNSSQADTSRTSRQHGCQHVLSEASDTHTGVRTRERRWETAVLSRVKGLLPSRARWRRGIHSHHQRDAS